MSQDYWEQRWQTNQTGWDIREVSPPLARFADYAYPAFHRLPVLVPGCGSGYEGMYLLDTGYTDITMLDISPTAIGGMEKRLEEKYQDWRSRLRLVCGDFFRHKGQYALILEQTFFCALTPSLRPHYVAKMAGLLQETVCLREFYLTEILRVAHPTAAALLNIEPYFHPISNSSALSRATTLFHPVQVLRRLFFFAKNENIYRRAGARMGCLHYRAGAHQLHRPHEPGSFCLDKPVFEA